jgi:ParB-like chromosome segregation protein Spo0J
VLPLQKGIGYYLIAGHCRLEAARKLKWESIPAVILTGLSADRALLAEIDENLVRNELSDVERAVHIRARKKLYEKLYPRSKHGGAAGAGRGRGKKPARKGAKLASFLDATSKTSGRSTRAVKRDSTRAKKIPGRHLARPGRRTRGISQAATGTAGRVDRTRHRWEQLVSYSQQNIPRCQASEHLP